MAQPQIPLAPALATPRVVRLVLDIEETPGRWLLDEENPPITPLHDRIIDLLKLILLTWAERTKRDALVARNFSCRWDPDDARIGLDPDLCLIEPAPPGGLDVTQLHTWEPGHVPPRLGIEIVSPTTAAKDYGDAARYARLGTREVWIFDALRQGPSSTGGPFVLQVWRHQEGVMRRVHAGSGPAWSEELGAWLVVTGGGRQLRIADDKEGQLLWPTADESEHAARVEAQRREQEHAIAQAAAERAQAEAEKAQREAEKAQREAEKIRQEQAARAAAAEAEVAALRLQLAALQGKGPKDS